jgi:hypothetical protein
VQAHGEIAWRLSDHHRIHAVSMHLEIEELLGDWASIVRRTPNTLAVVEANVATPCQRNARSLFVCAYAHFVCDDSAGAADLEASAERNALSGHNAILDPMRLRLALARADDDAVARLLVPHAPPPPWKHWYQLVTATIRLEALTATKASSAVEAEARPLLRPGTYLEPFARQALGLIHQDEVELDRALTGFRTLGLDWHHERLAALLASS